MDNYLLLFAIPIVLTIIWLVWILKKINERENI